MQHAPQSLPASRHEPTPRQQSFRTVAACSDDHGSMATECPEPASTALMGVPIRNFFTAKPFVFCNPRAGSIRRLQMTTFVDGIRFPCTSTTSACPRITATAAWNSGADVLAPDLCRRKTGGPDMTPEAVRILWSVPTRRAFSSTVILLGVTMFSSERVRQRANQTAS